MIKLKQLILENTRLGRCYELAGRYVSGHPKAVLVHGKLINPFGKGHKEIEHAWVEEDGEVFDPVMDKIWPEKVYYDLFKVTVYKKYSFQEVLKMIDANEHWGPWH